jgi:hypothetical protein
MKPFLRNFQCFYIVFFFAIMLYSGCSLFENKKINNFYQLYLNRQWISDEASFSKTQQAYFNINENYKLNDSILRMYDEIIQVSNRYPCFGCYDTLYGNLIRNDFLSFIDKYPNSGHFDFYFRNSLGEYAIKAISSKTSQEKGAKIVNDSIRLKDIEPEALLPYILRLDYVQSQDALVKKIDSIYFFRGYNNAYNNRFMTFIDSLKGSRKFKILNLEENTRFIKAFKIATELGKNLREDINHSNDSVIHNELMRCYMIFIMENYHSPTIDSLRILQKGTKYFIGQREARYNHSINKVSSTNMMVNLAKTIYDCRFYIDRYSNSEQVCSAAKYIHSSSLGAFEGYAYGEVRTLTCRIFDIQTYQIIDSQIFYGGRPDFPFSYTSQDQIIGGMPSENKINKWIDNVVNKYLMK